MIKKDSTDWGHVGGWYDETIEKTGSYQKEVILPNILRLLQIEKGEKILDLACGQGFFSRAFNQAGAKVFGVDAGKSLIEIAKENSPKDISYEVAKAEKLPFEKEIFDKAVCILALQNILEFNEAIAEVSRALKNNGSFYIVLNHPAFRIPGKSSWGTDQENGIQYRRVDTYLSESKNEIDMNPGEKNPERKSFTYSFHRPLQVYMKSLSKNGFAITKIEEWISHKESEIGPRKLAEDRARKEFPLFMAIECKKT